jgi:flagellar protein FliL
MADVEEQNAPKSKLDIKKILTFAFIGFDVAMLGFGLYLVYMATLGVQNKKLSNQQAEHDLIKFEESLRGNPVLYAMAPFNTNLEGVPRRLIRMDVSLEMMDEEGYEEVIGIAPQARDSIMRILNGKSFSDVESVQGKLHLKNEIVAQLNGSLKKGVVKNIYFNELVVQ